MAEGGGRGGHPHPHHVEGHRAADAHAQGGVQAQPGEDCLRDERVEPLQGVPRLHGVVRGACGRPDGGHAAPVRGVRAADREAEQKKIEQTVSEPAAAKQTTVSADAAPAEDEKRTTLSLSLTVSDKKALKMMAAERETTIAAIIHEWVAEHREDK